ncbi:MAG TPA: elongation factor P [Longimicrobiales bacterium]|nr:elongation factor P [Longimicrobiales bacterium]
MPMPATQIRRGNVIIFNGEPHRVIEFEHRTPGNLRAFIQAKMKNLRNGSTLEHRFRAADTVEKAEMSTHELQYLYHDGHHYHFMNTATYEMLELADEALGDSAQWLTENMNILAEFYEGRPIGIELPSSLELEIVQTEPTMSGATKTAMTKPAKLSNGVTVQVPSFVNQGERIRVDPRESKYLERAK